MKRVRSTWIRGQFPGSEGILRFCSGYDCGRLSVCKTGWKTAQGSYEERDPDLKGAEKNFCLPGSFATNRSQSEHTIKPSPSTPPKKALKGKHILYIKYVTALAI